MDVSFKNGMGTNLQLLIKQKKNPIIVTALLFATGGIRLMTSGGREPSPQTLTALLFRDGVRIKKVAPTLIAEL